MHTRRQHRGFTLLELVLVLVIICTTLAVASPSLRGWGRGSYLRNVADDFVAVTRYARTQAIATGQMHRLLVETGQCQLTTQSGEEFVSVPSNLGRLLLPEGFSISVTSGGQDTETAKSLDFFPTGRTQPARVRITSEQGEILEVECAAPAESFQVLNVGDTTR